MRPGPVRVISGAEVAGFGYPAAVDAIESALRSGLNPADDPPRASNPVGAEASMLYMPSLRPQGVGVKLVTLNPDNRAAGLPFIHAVYVLFDPATLAPTAMLDGTALTTLRTPAVSMAAVRPALRQGGTRPNIVYLRSLCGSITGSRPRELAGWDHR
jgi:ornithine cyclodeaminase